MPKLILLLFLLFPVLLSAQLIISSELNRRDFSDALDVEAWGENYLIRTSDQFEPFPDRRDELYFADEQGWEYYQNAFNPYDQESDFTRTFFSVLTDSTAVALAVDLDRDRTARALLTRFTPSGDTSLTRGFSGFSFLSYSLCSAGDSLIFAVGRAEDDDPGSFTVRAINSDFEDVYALKFEDLEAVDSRMIFNTIYADQNGRVYLVYERLREFPPVGLESDFFVATIDVGGVLISERPISNPAGEGEVGQNYTAVLPVGEDGIAVLEGFHQPEQVCATSACFSETGNLLIYPDATSSKEVYDLNFLPFGMELQSDGKLFVYGSTSLRLEDDYGVLFKPDGWPDGNRIHLIEDPFSADSGNDSYSVIYGMDIAENGDLVGTGAVGYGSSPREVSHWLFRIGPNGCFTADCSDLAEDPGNLVPTTNIENDLTIKTHPNPFTTTLNFTTPDSRPNDPVTVSLHDLSGRLLRSGKLEGGLEWATEDLPAGMYVVTFTSGGKRGVVKVVKE